MNMLTQDDLKAIGTLVGAQIEEKVPAIVGKAVEAVLTDPEGVINVKFDAVQEQLDGITKRMDGVEKRLDGVENKMLSKHDLERWEVDMTGRYDNRYVRP